MCQLGGETPHTHYNHDHDHDHDHDDHHDHDHPWTTAGPNWGQSSWMTVLHSHVAFKCLVVWTVEANGPTGGLCNGCSYLGTMVAMIP